MQTEEQRDEKTVVIATALGLFCLVVAAGPLFLWAVVTFFDPSDAAASAFLYVSAGVGVVVMVVYLARAPTVRRR